MTNTEIDVSPITVSIEVSASLEKAFELFTAGIGSWWPAGTHSIGHERVVAVTLQQELGGRLFEVWDNGEEKEWGRVLVWDPPRRVAMSWHPSLDPGTPTEVDVRFYSQGTATRVDVTHSGWELLAEVEREGRDDYLGGWPKVLERFRHQSEESNS